MGIKDQLKKILWFFVRPIFPFLCSAGRFFGYRPPYPPRQEFHLGFLSPGKTPEDCRAHLLQNGFVKHRVAWIDEGELWGLRRLDGFRYQYHIRLFNDGEIRGHYELTPEFSPLGHLYEKDMSARTEDFKNFLGECLTLEPPMPER